MIEIDQAPIGRTPRSNPATYTGVFTPIRDLYAMLPESRERGYKPGRFSFNVKGGRCEACQGDGMKRIEMNFLPDVYVTCDVCRGKRYNHETLQVKYKGYSIADLLEATVEEALTVLENIPQIQAKICRRWTTSARLHSSGAIGDDAVRRRSAAHQAGEGTEPRQTGRRSTSSTSRQPACTSKTSASCSTCCIGWWTWATRCSSSSITWTSSRRPTGSSISGPEGGEGGGEIVVVRHAGAGDPQSNEATRPRRCEKVMRNGKVA